MTDLSDILARFEPRQDQLLPVLHAIQADCGHVSDEAVRALAKWLNLSRAEVHGVVSFYHDFRTDPDPRPTLWICGAEACQARGADALLPVARAAAGAELRVETVYCLGLCSVGPAARLGDQVFARLDEAALVELVGRT